MSDLLKEIYIKRLEREKKAGTESEKIASVNAAYQQTGKVKGQREIDSLRQKSAALQVQSIEQNTAADKEQQKAEEQISRAQKLRDFNYDFYMDMLSEGIYDPNAARALGVSEKAYKGVLAKVQAAKAAKTATRKKASDTTEEIVEEIPAEESGELTYAQKQAAARRAMNDDVDGDGKRGKTATQGKKATVQELTSITQNPHEAAFAAEVNEIKASSNAIKELQSIPMSKAEADAAVKQLKTDGFYLHNSVQQQLKKTEQAEKLSTDYGFDTKTAITVNELQGMVQRHGNEKVMSTLLKYKNIGTDAETYTQNVIAEVVLADQAGKKRALKTEEKAMLFLMKDSSKVTENGRQMIDSVLAYDFKATLNEYRKKCKAMSNAELQAESENPKQEGMYSGYAAMVVGEELDKRFDAQRDEALNVLNEYSASSDEVTSPDIIASVTDSIESKLNGLIDPDEMISELEAKLGAYAQRGVILEEDQKKLDAYRADYDKLKKEYDAAKKKYEEDLAALNAVDPLTLAYYSENEQRRKELSEKGAPLVGRLTAIWQTREKGKDVAMMGDPRDITGYSPHVSSLPKFDKWDYWDRDAKIAGFSFSYNDLTAAEQDIVNYLLGKYPDTVSQDFGGSEGVFAYLHSIEDRVMRRLNADKTADSRISAFLRQYGAGVEDSISNTMYNLAQLKSGTYAGNRASDAQYQWQNAIEKYDIAGLGRAFGEALYSYGRQMPRQVVSAMYGPAGEKISDIMFGSDIALSVWNEKKAAGWTDAEAAVYTVVDTAFQIATEKLLDAKIPGAKGSLTKIMEGAADKFIKSGPIRVALKQLIGAGSEGLEEFVQGVGDYLIEYVVKNGQPESELEWSDLLYDAAVGAIVGAMGSTTSAVINVGTEAENDRTRRYAGKSDKLYQKLAKFYGGGFSGEFVAVQQMATEGYTLNETMKYARQNNFKLSSADVKKVYAAGKGSYIQSMSAPAESAYRTATGLDVQKQSAWLAFYNAGETGEKISKFDTGVLTPAQAKAAYEFGVGKEKEYRAKLEAMVDEWENNLYNENRNGGEVNGSENTGEMEEDGVYRGDDGIRQQGDDTQRYAKGLDARTQGEERNGRAWRGHPKSTGGWLAKSKKSAGGGLRVSQRILGDLRGKRLSNKDTAGRTLTEAQRKKYVNTVFKDENGNLISLYHWTDKIFERFAVGDIGFHFGTFFAAEEHRNERIGKSKTGRSIYKEVYLNIQKPILIYFDAVEWSPRNTVYELLDIGALNQNEAAALQKLDGYDLGGYDCEASVALRQLLTDKGYDGIVYFNENEDAGSLSVIAFSPDQIEIVQDIEETQAALDETVAKELFIAGMNGVPIERAADVEGATEQERRLMQTAYDNGKKRESRLGTAEASYRKGQGKVYKNKGAHLGIRADVPMMRAFAREHGLDVEILSDGSIQGKAAYDVAAFRILMSKSADNASFYHEVFENMLAISPQLFDRLERSMMGHYLRMHSLTELEDRIATYMSRYDTDDYALGRKEWVCSYAASLVDTDEGRRAFFNWLHSHDGEHTLWQRILDFFRRMARAVKGLMDGDWIGTAQRRKGEKLSAELEDIITLLEANRVRQTSLKDGQRITLGGGESAVRYSLPFYSMKEKDVNRIGWAEELFSDEDKMLLNDRFVDIMIHKDLGDAVRLKGGSYLLDVNNKIVIIGGSFNNPAIHFVMVINTDNATYAQEIKEVIFNDEHLRTATAGEASKYFKIYEDAFGTEIVMEYDRQSFGYDSSTGNLFARLPENFASYGYTQKQQDGSGVSAEDGGTGELRYSLDIAEVSEEKVAQTKRRLPSADAKAIGVHTARMDETARNSSRIPQGELVKRDIAVPRKVNGKKTMRWARTFFESGVGTPEMVDPIAEELMDELLSYKPISNETALNKAERVVEQQGYEGAIHHLEAQLDDGILSKKNAALGQLLLKSAAEAKDYHNVKKLVVLISEMGTIAGQTVQAMSILKRMDGEAKLFAVQRTVNRLNRELAAGKYGKKNTDMRVSMEEDNVLNSRRISVDPILIQRLLEAADDVELASELVTEIYKDVAQQLPLGKFSDGWNAWRHFAMLCAPTTHVRNVTGNVAFMPMVSMKNSLKRIGELLLVHGDGERTAKILPASKKAREFAREDALKMETILKSGGKYNEADVIEQMRQKLPDFLDKLEKGNSAAMEWEDWQFLRFHYVSTLSRYLDVNKIDSDNITAKQLARAREYAAEEAMKATYRDASRLASELNKIARNTKLGWVVDGILPFKKTPINVLKRGIEYSPVGLVKTLIVDSVKWGQQKITVNEWLDGMCAGLSGTLIFLLGALLCRLGIVQGGFDMDDDDPADKAQDDLMRLSGLQEYSIRIGNFSYTIDWAAPTAIPFFMGVEMMEAFCEEDGNLWNRIMDAVVDGADVIVNTSMLDGLQGTIDAIKYKSDAVFGILRNTAVNYVSQALPAVFGKQANLLDGTRRINYVDPDSKVPADLQRIGNKIAAKFPMLSGLRSAYVDEFGREKTEDNWALRFFQNFISPGYYSKIEYGELEQMMSEIYANAEDPAIIPTTASKNFKVNGERVYLSAKEYEQFAKTRGQVAHYIMTQMIESDNFDKLSYDDMQAVLKKAYEYSGAVAKSEVSEYELDGWQARAAKLEKKGVEVSDFILYEHLTSKEGYKREDVLRELQNAGLSYEESRRYISSIRPNLKRDYEDAGISVDVTVGVAVDIERGDYGDYQSAINKLVSAGHTEEDAVKAVHSEAQIGGDYIAGTIYTTGDLYNALVTDSKYYGTVYNNLVNAKVKGGRKLSASKTDIKSGLSRSLRSKYEKAEGKNRDEIKKLMLRSKLYGPESEVERVLNNWEKMRNK